MRDLKFERLSLDKGLSQSIVYSICQDSEGFMWFATQDGLNRYDGYYFKIYKNIKEQDTSLPINYVSALFEDNSGTIWVGGMNDNLSVYNKINDNFINYKIDDDVMIPPSSVITAITNDHAGNMYVGTFDGGLKKICKKNLKIEHFLNGDINNHEFQFVDISCLLCDSNGNIWIGTRLDGLFLYEVKNNFLKNCNCLLKKSNEDLEKRITCLFEDSKGVIWVGTMNGIETINISSNSNINHLLNDEIISNLKLRISSIVQDKKNNIWIGTKNSGLFKLINNKSYKIYTNEHCDVNSISSNSIYSLFVDRTNTLWVGTTNDGISKLDCERNLFENISSFIMKSEDRKIKNVSSVYKDNGSLWVGTNNNGLYKLEINNYDDNLYYNDIKTFDFFKNSLISGILLDNKSNVWISVISEGCIFKFNKKDNSFKKLLFDVDNGVHTIKSVKNKFLLGTVSKGIISFNFEEEIFEISNSELFKEFKITKDRIFCLLWDNECILWIGTKNEGLYKYNVETKELINFRYNQNDLNSLSDNFITCMHLDIKNNLWLGTFSGGLVKYDQINNNFERYDKLERMKENIKGILEDEDNVLWLSTYNGLLSFNPLNLSLKEYNLSDGLQSNEFNDGAYFKDKDGVMYFGGINGLTYFHPKEITDNPYIPNIVITDFEIFNQPVNGSEENPFLKKNIVYADEINLTYKESVFSFRFASLIFNNPQKNQYAYKMEGFDKEWTYCGTRKRVTYTNLNPGSYFFRVKGSNNDGIWNEKGTSIKINISPPYWKTWWFKGLGLLSAFAVTGYTYRQRMEKLAKESRDQEDFSRKLIEVQENEKMRIAHALHDTIAHDVLISKNKALLALKHRDNKEGLEKTLEEISELATNTITDVRNISYDLHPHQLERLGFTKTIRSIINEVSKSTNIKFEFESENVDELLSKESEINLFRVVQESISNIIKHSGATEAILTVSKVENHLLIVLLDNGRGFDVNSKEYNKALQGFGISGIIERIKFMNGEIKLDSDIGKGTTLRFQIPIKKKNE